MWQHHLSRRLALGLLAALLAVPSIAAADVGDTIRLQGRLTTPGGGPAPDGDYGLTVAFYAGKGDAKALFTYVDAGVKVQKGVFNVSIGATSKLDIKHFVSGKAGWVGIKVGSDGELPRLPINKVPYAIVADTARAVSCTGCVKAEHVDKAILDGITKQVAGVQTTVEKQVKAAEAANKAALAKLGADTKKVTDGLAKQVATKADAKAISKVGTTGQYKDLKSIPPTAKANQNCKSGQVVVGIDAAGKVKCATDKTNALSALDSRYVNTGESNSITAAMVKDSQLTGADIKNGTLTGADIADKSVGAVDLAPCANGYVLVSNGKNMVCSNVANTQQPAENFVANPTFYDNNGDNRPDHHTVKSGTSSSYYRFLQLSGGDLAALGGFSGKFSNPSIWATDLRSSSKSVDASLDIGVRISERTSMGAWVTCSVWVKRPDTVGTNAVAMLQCFGKTTKVTLKKGDTAWHRMSVTQRVVYPLAKGHRRMSVYGSGFATGGDPAYLRYGLPKLEYGPSTTAWTPGARALPKGMIAFFAQKCPPGWSEYTALRGRVPVGNPSSGNIAYARGSALGNKGARVITKVPKHLHAVDPPNTNSTSTGNHYHSHNHSAKNTTSSGKHRHYHNHPSHNTSTTGNHRHGINTRQDDWNDSGGSGPSWGDGDNGAYKSWHYSEYAGNHYHSVNLGGQYSDYHNGHYHTLDLGNINSSTTGNHYHQTNIAKFNSYSTGDSSVDVTMPYLQLVACYAQ